jgi:GNAT superfamily N-acetyltransferase
MARGGYRDVGQPLRPAPREAVRLQPAPRAAAREHRRRAFTVKHLAYFVLDMALIRKGRDADSVAMLAIVNAAAQAYRGVIPADRWREPYMPPDELEKEIEDGVTFWVAEEDGRLLGIMGIQDKEEVALVRHAYVAPTVQRKGVGTSLLRHVQGLTGRPVLIGTWADASWAIEFYRRNGFTVVPNTYKDDLLRRYWSIPARQIETSVVLADRRWMDTQPNRGQSS